MAASALAENDHNIDRLKALWVVMVIGFSPLAIMVASWIPTGLTPSTPILLIKGFAVPVLVAELFVILVAMSDGKSRQVSVTASPICRAAAIAVVVLAVVTALFVAPQPIESVMRTSILALHLLFGLSIYRLTKARILKPALLTNVIISGFMVAVAALILFAFQVRSIEGFDWMHNLPGFVNIRNLGYYAAPVTALMLARFALDEGATKRAWNLLCSTVAFALIFWSGSRGAAVALVATYAAVAIFCPALRSPKAFAPAVVACLGGALLAYAIGSPMDGMGVARMGQTETFSSGRIELWTSSIGPILDRPLFGYGEGQTIHVVPYAQEHRIFSPHNILVQTLLAWGAAGTLLLVVLAYPFARHGLGINWTKDSEFLPPAMGLVTIAAYSLIDGTLYYVLTTALFAAFAGILLAAPSEPRTQSYSAISNH